MESERSNCCTGRKVTGQLAGLLGLLLGIVLCAFIIYVGVESDQLSRTGIIKIALILMFVINIVATVFWVWGSFKAKKGLMLKSLICWGVPLNLWFGYMFLFTIRVIPYGPDLHYKYTTFEIVIPTLTLFLVFLFIVLMMAYNSFGKPIEKFIEFDYKLYGMVAGWVMIAFTVGEILLFLTNSDTESNYLYGGILLLVLNSIAAVTWLYGINTAKRGFIMVALVAWAIPLVIWIGLIIYGISEKGYNPGNRRQNTYNPIYAITVSYAFLYIMLASISRPLGVIRRNRPETDQFNVTYAPPPSVYNKLNV